MSVEATPSPSKNLPDGIHRTRDLTALGLTRTQVRRLADRGALLQLGRGLYSTPTTELTESHTLAEVCKRVPRGVICLASALQFHNLTTQNPWQVWLLLPHGVHAPRMEHPTLSVFRAGGEALTEGVEEHEIEGVTVRVTNVAKTVVDCFKYRNRIGLDVALEALKESLWERRTDRAALRHYARICRVERVMRPYMEAFSI